MLKEKKHAVSQTFHLVTVIEKQKDLFFPADMVETTLLGVD